MNKQTATLVALAGIHPTKVLQVFRALSTASDYRFEIPRVDLIGTEPAWQMFRDKLAGPKGEFCRLARQIGVQPPELHFHLLFDSSLQQPLYDLRHTPDNQAAWRQVLELMRQLFNDCSLIVGSVAGARKSLALTLMLAFQLLARPQDRLVDLVVDSRRPANGTKIPSPDSPRFHLAEIPLLRVRSLAARSDGLALPNLIAAVQPHLDAPTSVLLEFQLNPRGDVAAVRINGRTLWPNHDKLRVRRRDLAMWFYLASLRKRHRESTCAPLAPSKTEKQLRGNGLVPNSGNTDNATPCPCCFREAADLAHLVPDSDRELPYEYVRQAMSRIKRALIQFGLPLDHLEQVRFRGAGKRPNTMYGLFLPPEQIAIHKA
ncbi:MAG: hypothetical protein KatS3mg077_0563 [Candidatus Binatia bacterium]|nr:MAG: hypothetical protein KatS3mg077_0563 [Candidatus Binatia bacterium]